MLRVWQIDQKLWWDYDRSRDVLAGYLIWKYHDWPLVGHSAFGFSYPEGDGVFVLKYPPYYYFYLATLWAVGGSLTGVLTANALLHSLAVGGIYLIGRLMHHRSTGLLSAALFTFSETMVIKSWVLIGLQVGLPLYITALVLLALSFRFRKRWLNVLGLCGLLFGCMFHYSLAVPFTILFFVSELFFAGRATWLKRVLSAVSYGLLYTVLFGVLHVPVLAFFGVTPVLRAFLSNVERLPLTEIIGKFSHLLYYHLHSLFFASTWLVATMIVIGSVLVLIRPGRHQTRIVWAVLSLLSGILLLSGSARVEMYPHQAEVQTELAAVTLLLLSVISLHHLKKSIGLYRPHCAKFFGFVVTALLLGGTVNHFDHLGHHAGDHRYQQFQDLGAYILSASKSYSINPVIYSATEHPYGSQLALALPLELVRQERFFRFDDYYGDGITRLTPSYQQAVIICHPLTGQGLSRKYCDTVIQEAQIWPFSAYPEMSQGVCFSQYYLYWLGSK